MQQSIKKQSETSIIYMFLGYLWPKNNLKIKILLLIALLFLITSRIIGVYFPLIFKDILDALTPDSANLISSIPISLLFAYGAARVITQVLSDLKDALFIYLEQYATKSIAMNVFKRIHELSLDYHISKKTGGLSRAIERGVSSIEMFMRFFVFIIGPAILEIIFVSIILLKMYNWTFAAIIAITIILYIAYTLSITQWRIKLMRKMNDNETKANSTSIDSIMNYETVKYFNNEEHELDKYNNVFSNYQKTAFNVKASLALLNIGQSFIIAVGMVMVLYLAATGIKDGNMTIGDMVLINTYLLQLYMPLGNLGFSYRQIKMALVNMEEMFSIINQKTDITDNDNAKQLYLNDGEIEFDNVCFSYKKRNNILQGLSFTVPAKKTIAIVGPSGSGKSTISKLMFRFYDTDSGKILIDGQDIKNVTQKSLRREIGIVPQDTVLFNDTIYYNIAYAKPNSSKQEIEQAAKMANIHNFITSTPDGYNTIVGERGMKLSGGEKQRIAIARAILKNPKIFIFDEATSALDTHTEKEILKSIKKISSNKTTIIIAHRLSTIVDADIICVLKNGAVIESGTHEELLQAKGEYYNMWQRQVQKQQNSTS